MDRNTPTRLVKLTYHNKLSTELTLIETITLQVLDLSHLCTEVRGDIPTSSLSSTIINQHVYTTHAYISSDRAGYFTNSEAARQCQTRFFVKMKFSREFTVKIVEAEETADTSDYEL